jgi:hypothetical protein
VEKLVGKSEGPEKNARCDSGLTRFEQIFVQSPQAVCLQQFENVYTAVTECDTPIPEESLLPFPHSPAAERG